MSRVCQFSIQRIKFLFAFLIHKDCLINYISANISADRIHRLRLGQGCKRKLPDVINMTFLTYLTYVICVFSCLHNVFFL